MDLFVYRWRCCCASAAIRVWSGTSIAALPQHRKYISMKALCSRLARIWEGGKMDGTLVEIVLESRRHSVKSVGTL
jgi:hypothetical protein